MKKLVFTDHAFERMYLRSISESLIQTTVDHYDDTEYEDDGDIKFIKDVNNTFAIFIEKYSHRMVFDGKHIQQTEN